VPVRNLILFLWACYYVVLSVTDYYNLEVFQVHDDEHRYRVPASGCVFNPLNPELNPICYLLALLSLTIFSTLAG